MKFQKSRKPSGPPKGFPKRGKPLGAPPPMLPSDAPPAADSPPLPAAPMFNGGGAVSDMDMDDSPRASKRMDRKRKAC